MVLLAGFSGFACVTVLVVLLCTGSFFLAFVVFPLKVSFFGVRESFSLDKAEDGDRGESSLSLSSLSAWILWGVGGPVWGLLPSSPAEAGVGEVGVLGPIGVVAVAPAWLGLEGTLAELGAVGELWSCNSFRAWLRVQTVRLGGVVKAVTGFALSAWPFIILVGVLGAELGCVRLNWALLSSGFISQLSPPCVSPLGPSASSAAGGDLEGEKYVVILVSFCVVLAV